MLEKLSIQAEFVFSTDRQPVKQVRSVVSILNVCRDLPKASPECKGETWDVSYDVQHTELDGLCFSLTGVGTAHLGSQFTQEPLLLLHLLVFEMRNRSF